MIGECIFASDACNRHRGIRAARKAKPSGLNRIVVNTAKQITATSPFRSQFKYRTGAQSPLPMIAIASISTNSSGMMSAGETTVALDGTPSGKVSARALLNSG